jgi:hypothetical protein
MSYSDSIANSIAYLAQNSVLNDPLITNIVGVITKINTVTDINGTTTFASVLPFDSTLNELGFVQLSPNNSSLNFTPSVGSTVIVNLFDENSGYISQYGAVSQVTLAPGSTNYSGMCIVGDVTTKLNNLESTVNDLRNMILDFQTIYNAHTHEVASFGTPSTNLQPTYDDTAPSALTLTQASDIENPQVTHGNGIPDQTAWYNNLQLIQNNIAQQQVFVKNALNAITSYQQANPGQPTPANLTSAYQQSTTILQNQEQTYINLTNNPPF